MAAGIATNATAAGTTAGDGGPAAARTPVLRALRSVDLGLADVPRAVLGLERADRALQGIPGDLQGHLDDSPVLARADAQQMERDPLSPAGIGRGVRQRDDRDGLHAELPGVALEGEPAARRQPGERR